MLYTQSTGRWNEIAPTVHILGPGKGSGVVAKAESTVWHACEEPSVESWVSLPVAVWTGTTCMLVKLKWGHGMCSPGRQTETGLGLAALLP